MGRDSRRTVLMPLPRLAEFADPSSGNASGSNRKRGREIR